MSDVKVTWTSDDDFRRNIEEYGRRVKQVAKQIALYWSPVLEAYAKENRPWTDRTGNARQGLHTFIEELSDSTVRLYLSHGVDYGSALETKYAGRYSIIWPAIQAHLPAIMKMLKDVFK